MYLWTGLPIMSPNYNNMQKVVAHGFGQILDWSQLNADTLYKAMYELLKDPKSVCQMI
jgi:hypothetical protein